MDKPFSPACERNAPPLIEQLSELFANVSAVLEIGSGTGQHAVALAAALPHLRWQPSDLPGALAGIEAWRAEAGLANLEPARALDVSDEGQWPQRRFDAVFSANTAHILAWPGVAAMLRGVARVLEPCGPFALYGPFNRNGRFTSEGNRALDAWARERFAGGGLRDLEAMAELAREHGLRLCEDRAMPANNRLLVFRHRSCD